MSVLSVSGAARQLKAVFESKGVRSALAFLNSLTPHRFTSLFRFDREMLRSVVFYDRENPDQEKCDDIPVEASYCVFVRNQQAKFIIEEARCDARVDGHAKQPVVQCYCGVPLIDDSGRMFGTICHFDLNPGRVSESEVELLECMGRLLQSAVQPV